MIRKAGIATLILAFVLATMPAEACTGISLTAKDGTVIRGRTLEFGFPLQSNVLVIPPGKAMSGTLPDGGKGVSYTSKYGIIGANAVNLPIIVDGVNDQGLGIGLFYFPGYAGYTAVTPENASHALAPHEFGAWVLANFATIDEVKRAVKDIVIVPTPTPGLGSAQGSIAGVHFYVQDKSGKAIVIEPIAGGLKVYDNPLKVLTNAPTFDWQLTNLNNYVNLSVTNVAPVTLDSLKLSSFGQGGGMHGMPGDFTPPSRFVRAVAFSQAAAPTETADDTVLAVFHILNQFDIPVGSVREVSGEEVINESTQWTSVTDLTNARWYFRTYGDQSIHMIDVRDAIAAAKGEIGTISMDSTQPIVNVSTKVVSAK
jgi:choloylglycine hydrolase